MRLLAGLPLYMHSIAQARAAGASRIVLTTDIEEVIQSPPQGVEVVKRPPALARDDTPMAPVVGHVLEHARIQGTTVLLQPTSPLRKVEHIAAGIDLFLQGRFELVLSVTKADNTVLKWGLQDKGRFLPVSDVAYCFANRQQLPDVFKPNGAVYVFQAQWFLEQQGFETDRMGCFEMSAQLSRDIDAEEDFVYCENLLMTSTMPKDIAP